MVRRGHRLLVVRQEGPATAIPDGGGEFNSPGILGKPTRQHGEESPVIDADAPVSRQLEANVHGHYGWSRYWNPGFGLGTTGALPFAQTQAPFQRPSLGYRADGTDPTSGHSHFRSANEIIGYHVRANDDHIGHVEELLMDIDD